MSQKRRPRQLAALGGSLLAIGAIFALYCALGNYGVTRNAYYDCDARPSPMGAFEFEAGHAGSSARAFPVAGVECRWNAIHGPDFTTFHPDVGLTVVGWTAFGAAATGFVALCAASIVANRRPRA